MTENNFQDADQKVSSNQKLVPFDSANLDPLEIKPDTKIEFMKLKEDIKYIPKESPTQDEGRKYLEGLRNKAYLLVTIGKIDPAKDKVPDKNLLEKIKAGEEIKTQSTGLTLKDVLEGKTDGDRTTTNPQGTSTDQPNSGQTPE